MNLNSDYSLIVYRRKCPNYRGSGNYSIIGIAILPANKKLVIVLLILYYVWTNQNFILWNTLVVLILSQRIQLSWQNIVTMLT